MTSLFTEEGIDGIGGRQAPSDCLTSDTSCISVYKETGCKGTAQQYQGIQQYQCAQLYYEKKFVAQQNKPIPQPVSAEISSTSQQTITELKVQIKTMQQELDSLKAQPYISPLNGLILGSVSLIALIIAAILYRFLKTKAP